MFQKEMRFLKIISSTIVLLALIPFCVSAQFGQSGGFGGGGFGGGGFGGGGFGSGGFGSSPGGGTQTLTLDTSDIFYFFAENPSLIFPFTDSLLNEFQQYDPTRQRVYDYAHLGNLGSAHRPLVYEPSFRRGFDIGFHQFDLYQTHLNDVPFYKIEQAYTKASFSQGPTQEDLYFTVQFSQNFANGINLVVDHKKINNIGSYDRQLARNNSSVFGMWYHAPTGRYDGFFTYIHNNLFQQDNGGIIEPTDTIIPPFQVDVTLQNAETKIITNEFSWRQYFYLNRGKKKSKTPTVDSLTAALQDSVLNPRLDSILNAKRDSLDIPSPDSIGLKKPPLIPPGQDTIPQSPPGNFPPPQQGRPPFAPPPTQFNPQFGQAPPPPDIETFPPDKRAFTVYHHLRFKTNRYKFFDDAVSDDSTYYGDMLVDSRGLRNFVETRELENTFKLQTFKLGEKDTSGVRRQNDLIEAGLIHSLHFVDQEPADTSTINQLFLTGKIRFNPGERLRIQAYGHLGFLNNGGDYRLSGELFLDFKKVGNLKAELVNQLYTPSLIQHRLFISQKAFWENDFDKTLETSLAGTYELPAFRFSATLRNQLITNFIYYDTLATPKQHGTAINILQVMLRKDFKLGPFAFNNLFVFQNVSQNVLRLPSYFSKHSLYFEGRVFKKVLETRIGFDLRLSNAYKADAYNPLIGQFHLQDEQDIPFAPLLDAFINFRVNTFRFFVKVENLLTPIRNQYYYQTARQALPFSWSNGGLRFGLSWRLVD